MRADLPPRRRPIEGAGLNILLLTSEFAPAMGGIGTYAREIAAAASRLGAKVTVVAPDYARQTGRRRPLACPSRSSGFAAAFIPCATCRPRSCWRAAASAAIDTMWSMPPIGRSSFRVALSRWRTPARVLMTVHGTEINETQTPLKRLAIRGAGVFGPRTEVVANSRLYPKRCSASGLPSIRGGSARSISAYRNSGSAREGNAARFALAYRLAEDRLVMITVARITRRKGHHLTLAALSRLPGRSAPVASPGS